MKVAGWRLHFFVFEVGPAFTAVSLPVIQFVFPLSEPGGVEMAITGSVFSKVLDENKVFINNVEVPIK